MRVEQIEVGKTYEGGKLNRKRRVIFKGGGYLKWISPLGSVGYSGNAAFEKWAVREVPHAN